MRSCQFDPTTGSPATCSGEFHAHATMVVGSHDQILTCATCADHRVLRWRTRSRFWWDETSVHKIVSGGQTGADRGGLASGIHLGISVGGWIPLWGRADDGEVPREYANFMVENDSLSYPARTRLNVRDSDATLVVTNSNPGSGSRLTLAVAEELGRPVLHVDLSRESFSRAAHLVRTWVGASAPGVLNVAGSRESDANRMFARVAHLVTLVLSCPRCGRSECLCPCPRCGALGPRRCSCDGTQPSTDLSALPFLARRRELPHTSEDVVLPIPREWTWLGNPAQMNLF